MNLYVASKWENRARVREVMNDLQSLGHTITQDWTQVEQESADQAAADMFGVLQAESLIILAEEDWPFRGTYVELGLGLAANIPVFFIGPYARTIFDRLPSVRRFDTYRDFIQWFSL